MQVLPSSLLVISEISSARVKKMVNKHSIDHLYYRKTGVLNGIFFTGFPPKFCHILSLWTQWAPKTRMVHFLDGFLIQSHTTFPGLSVTVICTTVKGRALGDDSSYRIEEF